jgi:hypothetical protein
MNPPHKKDARATIPVINSSNSWAVLAENWKSLQRQIGGNKATVVLRATKRGRPTDEANLQRIKEVAFARYAARWNHKHEWIFFRPLPNSPSFWPELSPKEARNRFSTFLIKKGDAIEKAVQELSFPY